MRGIAQHTLLLIILLVLLIIAIAIYYALSNKIISAIIFGG
jgi:hypothetical protein